MAGFLGNITNVHNLVATGTGTFTGLIVSGSFTGTITQANTAARAYTLPDKDGTFAMMSDIVAGGGVTLDTTQTITGLKSFQQGDNASLGAECITAVADRDFSAAGAWTGTGWSIVSGALAHTAGANVATLPNTSLNITPTNGVVYVIAMKIITTTLGTVTLSFGGVSLGIVAGQWVGTVNVNKYVLATGSGALTVTPDATWVGSIDDVSIKILTRSSYPSMRLFTTAGGTAAEIRNYNNTNFGLGNAAHRSNVSGTHNYGLGYYAQAGLTTGIANIAIGSETQEFLTNGTHNIGIGYFTQNAITSSSYNIGIGGYSQRYLTTGFNNVALGFQAQQALTVGWNNMALGAYAQMAITSGTANVAIGKSSQTALTTGSQNMGIGGNSLLKVTTGSYNVAIGNNSGYNIVTTSNNTGIGTDTLFNATASDNTAIGYGSLVDLTTGGYNTALGSLSGDGATNATITYCSFFGYNARSTTDGITNSTAIGNGAVVTASNQIQLGNTAITSVFTHGNLTLGVTTGGSASPQKIFRVNGGANADLAPVVSLFRTGNSEGGMAIVASKLKLFQGGGLGGYTDALITAANGFTIDMSGNVVATGTITGTNGILSGSLSATTGTFTSGSITLQAVTYPSIAFYASGTGDTRLFFRVGNELRWRYDGTNDANVWTSATFSPASKANTDQTMYIGTTAVAINRASAALNLTLGGNLTAAAGGFTDTVSVSHPSSTSTFRVNAISGQIGGYYFGVAGQTRASLYCDANSVSFGSWDSSGIWIDQPMVIPNSTGGTIQIYRPIAVSGTGVFGGTSSGTNYAALEIKGTASYTIGGSRSSLVLHRGTTTGNQSGMLFFGTDGGNSRWALFNDYPTNGTNDFCIRNIAGGVDALYFNGSNVATFANNVNAPAFIASVGMIAPYFQGYLASQGNYAASAPGTTRGPNGLNLFTAYANGYPINYGNLLHVLGTGATQLLLGWSGTDGAHADNYVRSKRDNDTGAWSPWAKLITDVNIGDTGVAIGGTTGLFTTLNTTSHNTWSKAQTVDQLSLNVVASTLNIDASASNNQRFILTVGSITLANPTNLVSGKTLNLVFVQDSTGNRAISSWGTMWKFAGGTKPTLSTAPNAIDIMSCYYDGSNLLCALMKGMA